MRFRLFAFAILSLSFILISCGDEGSETAGGTQTAEKQERPESPPVQVRIEYQTSGKSNDGYPSAQETFDQKGNRIEMVYYKPGSNEVDRTITYQYGANGKVSSSTDGTITEVFEYDENGNVISETWYDKDGNGAKKVNGYDGKGRLIQSQFFSKEGELDYTRVYEREYDENDSLISEKHIEKYADGSPDLFKYHYRYTYNPLGQRAKKEFIDGNGMVYSYETYAYSNEGYLAEVKEYNENDKMVSRTANDYNEFGELFSSQNYSFKDKLNFSSKYLYDEYGHLVNMRYSHASGDMWGERIEFKYFE